MDLKKLTLMPYGLEVQLPAGSPLTDLERGTSQRVIPFGCQQGACGACVIEVLDGFDALGEMDPEEADFLEDLGQTGGNYRLACQCRLMSAATVRVADAL
ncbi:ferredoxin [Streptomyces dangxiongensis]|uniref:Ferredoxin n=1 Tax=Streptomyces dangxiongensis TaxID=1442032 RepID=A0A3G2J9S2_9ACTN|nr:2Fe-2S iron-sulfur cluster-binding protein [Streptomyces dangxiongensis]AYN39046.1 ferredoxin [Streptomyces dangxiongensis]